ncbi:hypothetical protein A1OE_63 [Candidatus Endolissoclinum faulkneri L2]|uniref:Uncharacterized protein n=1 Tax=Candidatus Endolissoclinum faulkneri L2 TaxID=1193729 RepID=K7YLB1_9PROT|nr:hypothetical protein A1OE_63 [Candidatus Endolissoclinum faulkneri L2]
MIKIVFLVILIQCRMNLLLKLNHTHNRLTIALDVLILNFYSK